jgi:hypothetical protein
MGSEMLRCAQHDNGALSMTRRVPDCRALARRGGSSIVSPIRINLRKAHQLQEGRGRMMWGWVGLDGRPPSLFLSLLSRTKATSHPHPREAIKASPTDHPASSLPSWRRLMPIGRPSRPTQPLLTTLAPTGGVFPLEEWRASIVRFKYCSSSHQRSGLSLTYPRSAQAISQPMLSSLFGGWRRHLGPYHHGSIRGTKGCPSNVG